MTEWTTTLPQPSTQPPSSLFNIVNQALARITSPSFIVSIRFINDPSLLHCHCQAYDNIHCHCQAHHFVSDTFTTLFCAVTVRHSPRSHGDTATARWVYPKPDTLPAGWTSTAEVQVLHCFAVSWVKTPCHLSDRHLSASRKMPDTTALIVY